MNPIVSDALIDSLKMVPFLLVIYVLVEWLERRLGETIKLKMQKAAKIGPLVGALFGCIPQCGFSVLASAMYTKRLLSVGTLLAVFLSTSDEAVPVILSQPGKAGVVIPILVTKLVIAVVAGFTIDILLHRRNHARADQHEHEHEHGEECHCAKGVQELGCCEHHIAGWNGKWEYVTHPLIHTAKVFVFIFAVSLGINWLLDSVGEQSLQHVLLGKTVFQPVITAIVGLIPNCASSVAITEVFLKGGISFGSAISGLCASAGLGILVLLKENKDRKDTLRVLGLLVGISIAVGIIIQYLYG